MCVELGPIFLQFRFFHCKQLIGGVLNPPKYSNMPKSILLVLTEKVAQ